MNANVIRAIFKRNFVSYFSNPTGYVFICVFVLLSSFAAFWPNEFFNSNLANLDQLNKYLPYIMLVFIPAITMSIWADERRQGTDELLLTIPAGDFDVVLGKYLAAVAIFSVSLLFSLVSNYCVLRFLGFPDLGLLFGTYTGYWIVGLAMLGIGMVASFLTGNLTVGFILGAVFNAPLAFAGSMPDWLSLLRRLSITEQFRDFSSGVISLASVGYFLAIVALMLYLSVVLIGRRHWRGGNEGRSTAGHYAVRFIALLMVVVCLNVFLSHHDRLRVDVTSEGLSSLASQSRELLGKLDAKRPVVIEYFVSPTVPENYVQTRLNLISALRELQAVGGDNIQVIRHEVEPFSNEATRAEQQFGIKPVPVESRTRGARTREEIFMGLAFTCGLDKVVLPFLDKGIPVEYELVRSIATVSQQKRKKIGVLITDAKLYGTFDMQTFSPPRNELIIDELQKQYDVVQVDPTNPIAEKYDVLLAVQPSSLSPPQLENFIAAVKNGQPTAIFEDPFPWMAPDVPGTKAPKQPPGAGNPFMQQRMPPQPKGDIAQLWKLLGVDFGGDNVVWQDYNPLPKLGGFVPREWVFVDHGSGAKQPFNPKNSITSRLQQVLFLFPGAVTGLNSSPLKFTELVSTSDHTGTIRYDQILERSFMGQPRMNPELPLLEKPTNDKYVLAAQIRGKLKTETVPMSDKSAEANPSEPVKEAPSEKNAAGEKDAKPAESKDARSGQPPADAKPPGAAEAVKVEPEINVVLVSDIDCLYGAFFALRARGDDPDAEIDFNFDNVPFVLNVLDVLAGDERFVEIRTRRPVHRTLKRVSDETEKAREVTDKEREKFVKKFEDTRAQAQKAFDDQLAELKKRTGLNQQQALIEIMQAQQVGQRRLETKIEQLKQERDREIKKTERQLSQKVREVQDGYKLWAVLLPPIPPLIVAFVVFFNRRAKEREGVSKARLR
ncbi:MAG: Gldg family protein [Planctomycetia bacterium]|nr:Gldg family protein [Planctomycetia bacterium]